MFKTPLNPKRKRFHRSPASDLDVSFSPEFKKTRIIPPEVADVAAQPTTSEGADGDRECEDGVKLDIPRLLSSQHGINVSVCRNICKLLEDEHKVAFIARYRKAQTDDIDPERLKLIADSYKSAADLQQSVSRALKQLKRDEKITPSIRKALLSVSNKAELETVMEPFKKGPRTTLAARARESGLESAADELLKGTARWQVGSLVDSQTSGRQSVKAVTDGLAHIICDIINKDADVQCQVIGMASSFGLALVSTRKVAKQTKSSDAKDDASKLKSSDKDEHKFRNYFDYRKMLDRVRSHEYLAICRAESRKIVTVKVEVPDNARHKFQQFCRQKFLHSGIRSEFRTNLIERCIADVYSKQTVRAIERQARATLRQRAETDALRVMARNLGAKLLTPPIRGRIILAMDPGFRQCKLAVVSAQSEILYTGVICPRLSCQDPDQVTRDPAANQLRSVVQEHSVSLIGIGNGTACSETWRYLSAMNAGGWLAGHPLDVTLVDEGGVSEYSATPLAAAEMPQLDCTVRSAVALARRLQDPISEYVKAEVTSLGVGMYQKDMPATRVSSVLGEAVEQAVASVGVDINTASLQLLRRVPGLNITRAQSIVDKRVASGAFINRSQLKELKGLGPKSYQQCAGFIKILPETVNTAAKRIDSITPKRKLKRKKDGGRVTCDLEPLDSTIVHPESYPLARHLLQMAGCSEQEIGCPSVTSRLTDYVKQHELSSLAERLTSDIYTVKLVISALSDPSRDVRDSLHGPMFFKSMMSSQQLVAGRILQAVVRNPTDFGVFVDLGVGENGFIHHSQMNSPVSDLKVNDRVEVRVLAVSRQQRALKIELRLIRVLHTDLRDV